MTSRERILAAIEHSNPDRMPVGATFFDQTYVPYVDGYPDSYNTPMRKWGVLNIGTPQQVMEQVHERMEIFSQGGGFVFNTVHNILPDVPPENIVAMFNAVKEFNDRRIR